MRVFAISDIHIDYPENMRWIERLSDSDYRRDALILAGDATHELERLERVFSILKRKFAQLYFVPGNHELWTLKSNCADSIEKFQQIMSLCARVGVRTTPNRLEGASPVWITPLFSWYAKPEDGSDSLFQEKPGEDPSLASWSDNYFVTWPDLGKEATASAYFLGLNRGCLARSYDAPIISFSHFLPRIDLIFSKPDEDAAFGGKIKDRHRPFNFSRVAGSKGLEIQIRALGSVIHVYGHQHRNRYRMTDGILYVSHCLGYAIERKEGHIRHVRDAPRLLWDTDAAIGNEDIRTTTCQTT